LLIPSRFWEGLGERGMVPAKGQVWGHSDAEKRGIATSQLGTVADRILDAVHCAPGCLIDDLVLSLPGLTWNQVFLEVDRLSRTGQVRVTAMGEGTYAIRLPNTEKSTRTPHHRS
jgi:hypothetical protein